MKPRTDVAGIALCGFAATGLLAGGLLDAVTEPVRVVVAFVALIVAPAFLVRSPVARALGLREPPALESFAPAVLAVLSMHALLAQVFLLVRAPFHEYAHAATWLILLFHLAVLALSVYRRRRVTGWRVSVSGFGFTVLVVATLFAAWLPSGESGTEDALDHMGHVRRIIALDRMQPDGVLIVPEGEVALPPDTRKGALHAVVALATGLADADPVTGWRMLRVVMFPLLLVAFAGFARTFVKGTGAMILCMALFVLSYGGTAFKLAAASGYGQNLATLWYWVLAMVVLRHGEYARRSAMTAAAVAAGGVLMHLGVALHVAVLAASLLVFGGTVGMNVRTRLGWTAWLSAGALAGVVLRVAGAGLPQPGNWIHTHAQGIMQVGAGLVIMSPMEILRQHGMVALGAIALLPVAAVAARGRPDVRKAYAFCAIPVTLALFPPLSTLVFHETSYLGFRSLLNAPLLPMATLCLLWLVRAGRHGAPVARGAAFLVLTAWCLLFLRPTLGAFATDASNVRARFADVDPYRALDDAVQKLPAASHILSDPFTAYRLSAHTSMRFVAVFQQHANPADPLGLARLAAVRDALSPFVLPVAAVAVCREYDIDYVVLSGIARPAGADYLSPGPPELFEPALERLRSMPEVYREVENGGDFAIFRFDPRGVAENRWNGIYPPVRYGETTPAACRVEVPDDAFEITGFSIDRPVVSAGDSLYVTFGYRRNAPASYGNPLEMHVRFDHADIVLAQSYPGDKFVRRFEERRTHALKRYRVDLLPGHGLMEPDLWPMGSPLIERFGVRLPATLAPGDYTVQVKVVPRPLLPNFTTGDLLFNRDHYSGEPCATLRVAPGGGR